MSILPSAFLASAAAASTAACVADVRRDGVRRARRRLGLGQGIGVNVPQADLAALGSDALGNLKPQA